MEHKHYVRLLLMAIFSFVSMYILMYAMVDAFENVRPNVNQAYMAGLMTAPMVVIELALMGSMYPHKRMNALIVAGSIAALAVLWFLIRGQVAVTDRQFLKSMIPHHGGAILMCEKAPLTDAGVRSLCGRIISSQQSEIREMNALLRKLEK